MTTDRPSREIDYDHNPSFRRFIEESGLPFDPYAEFRKAGLDARQHLDWRFAEQIWSSERRDREAAS